MVSLERRIARYDLYYQPLLQAQGWEDIHSRLMISVPVQHPERVKRYTGAPGRNGGSERPRFLPSPALGSSTLVDYIAAL